MAENLPIDDERWSPSELAAAKSSIHRFPEPVNRSAQVLESAADESILNCLSAVFRDLPPSRAEDGGLTNNCANLRSYAQSLLGVRAGRFLIQECLGYGGFGIVFRATDGELDRDVALKIP